MRDKRRTFKKLKDLITAWEKLKKNKNRKSETQKMNEKAFTAEFPNLFDISHGNAFRIISIQEDRDFLLAQRQPGWRGCLAGLEAEQKER